MGILLIVLIILWSIIGFCIYAALVVDDAFDDANIFRTVVATFICGPLAWLLVLGAYVYNNVGAWLQGE